MSAVTKYRTIVVDPPWKYDEGWGVLPGSLGAKAAEKRNLDWRHYRHPLPYPSMSLAEIRALPISELADRDGCHVYLWTTNRYLRDAFDVLGAWGVRFGQVLVWAKKPFGAGMGGAFVPSTEFILFGRLGTLPHRTRVNSTWFAWPRPGNNLETSPHEHHPRRPRLHRLPLPIAP